MIKQKLEEKEIYVKWMENIKIIQIYFTFRLMYKQFSGGSVRIIMSFFAICNPKERDRIIKEHLAVKNCIKERSMLEREGDMKREGELVETFNPIIQSNEKAALEIQKSNELLNEQMEEMNKKLEKK